MSHWGIYDSSNGVRREKGKKAPGRARPTCGAAALSRVTSATTAAGRASRSFIRPLLTRGRAAGASAANAPQRTLLGAAPPRAAGAPFHVRHVGCRMTAWNLRVANLPAWTDVRAPRAGVMLPRRTAARACHSGLTWPGWRVGVALTDGPGSRTVAASESRKTRRAGSPATDSACQSAPERYNAGADLSGCRVLRRRSRMSTTP